MTVNNTFVRPILDYAYIIYDKPLTESIKHELDMVQYNAALVITSVVKDASRDHIYRDLGLEAFAEWRWSGNMFFIE